MKKVIILCSALVFDFLTCSDVSAVAQERINNVQSADSATVVTDTLSELRRTARFASGLGVRLDGELVNVENEYTWAANLLKSINAGKLQMWTGDLKLKVEGNDNVRFENNRNKCLARGLNSLKEILNKINRRIDRLQNAIHQSQRQPQAEAQDNASAPSSNDSTPSSSRRSSLTNSESSDNMNGYNYDDYIRERIDQEYEGNQGQQQAEAQDNASAPSSNDSTPSISRQSSFFSNSDGYPTKEEEQKATDTEIIDKNREPGTQENFAPSENNGTNTNSFGQNFLGHLREEYGDYPSYDLSSSSSRRSSVSSTNSKFSNADHQSDSGNESSSNDANGFGSTFSNHYNDSLFDN